ncbi:MAG: hypothetical protein HOO90_02440 [Methylotenera sp.]|uniref:hypothetical protein n=1 Tax=Methylotenera sp. TaxID=2051956 RepID=UPI00182EDA44|nr:hypothetical protein [Methylotenera sp.]NOU24377.1 hypothetical protein [Methylotenera sp.]
MPYILGSIHILIALFFAVHAMRTGRQMYWLLILFSFPLLGSAVYFFAEYLPSSKVERGVKQVSSIALTLLDPTRELREARQAFDLTPTVQNRMRLAAALDGAGEYNEAVVQFDACLSGPFANDPEVCFGAAKAKIHNKQPHLATELLLDIRQKQATFRPEELSLLLAQSYAESQDNSNAGVEFAKAAEKFGSAETRVRYALWAASTGDIQTAKNLKTSLEKDWQHWNKHTRGLYKALFNELDAALANPP